MVWRSFGLLSSGGLVGVCLLCGGVRGFVGRWLGFWGVWFGSSYLWSLSISFGLVSPGFTLTPFSLQMVFNCDTLRMW